MPDPSQTDGLHLVLEDAKEISPERGGYAVEQSKNVGGTPDLYLGNPEPVSTFDPEQLKRNSPKLYQQAMTSTSHAASLRPDFKPLSWYESLKTQISEEAMASQAGERGRLWVKQYPTQEELDASLEERRQREELHQKLLRDEPNVGLLGGFTSTAIAMTAGFGRSVGKSWDEALAWVGSTTAAGATAGAAGGAIAGFAGGPAAPATVPAGAAAGAVTGAGSGLGFGLATAPVWAPILEQSFNDAGRRLEDRISKAFEEGKEITPQMIDGLRGEFVQDFAYSAAANYLVGKVLSVAGGRVAKSVGLSKAANPATTNLWKELQAAQGVEGSASKLPFRNTGTDESVIQMLGRGFKGEFQAGSVKAPELPKTTLQKIGTVSGRVAARTAHAYGSLFGYGAANHLGYASTEAAAQVIIKGGTPEEAAKAARAALVNPTNLKNAWKAGVESAKHAPAMIAGLYPAESLITHAVVGVRRYQIEKQMRKDVRNAGSARDVTADQVLAENSGLSERAPNLMGDYVNDVSQGGQRYIPIEVWDAHWVEQGINPRDKAKEILGSDDPYTRANDSGIKLQIPLDKYINNLAGKEHGEFFTQETTSHPDALSIRETGEQQVKRAANVEKASKITTEFKERIEGASPRQQAIEYGMVEKTDVPGHAEALYEALSPEAKEFMDSPAGSALYGQMQNVRPVITEKDSRVTPLTERDLEIAKEHARTKEGPPAQGEMSIPGTELEKPTPQEETVASKPRRTPDPLVPTAIQTVENREAFALGIDDGEPIILGPDKNELVTKYGIDPARADEVLKAREDLVSETRKESVARGEELLREVERKRQEDIKNLVPEALEELDKDRSALAFSMLKEGKTPSGAPLGAPIKLSNEELISIYGKEYVEQNIPESIRSDNPKETAMSDDLAAVFGFDNGRDLVDNLIDMGDPSVEAVFMASERLRRSGDESVLMDQYKDSVWLNLHNNNRNRNRIVSELNNVGTGAKNVAKISADALAAVKAMSINDLKETNFKEAMARESKLADDALQEQDLDKYTLHKNRELGASERHREAANILQRATAAAREIRDTDLTEMAGAGKEYEHVGNEILRKAGLGPQGTIKDETPLSESIDTILEQTGVEIDDPTELAASSTPESMRVTDLIAAQKSLKSLALAIKRRKVLNVDGEYLPREEGISRITESLLKTTGNEAEPDKPNAKAHRTLRERIKDTRAAAKGYIGMASVLSTLLDADNAEGVMTKTFTHEQNKSELNSLKIKTKWHDEVAGIFRKFLTKDELEHFGDKKYAVKVPGLGSLTLEDRIGIAMHQGTDYNKKTLRESRKLTQPQIEAILDTLDERHVRLVEAYWRSNESKERWAEIVRLEREASGREVEKAPRTPWITKFGTIRGGYHPVAYNKTSWAPTRLNAGARLRNIFGAAGAGKMTDHGYNQARVKAPEGGIVRTDADVILEHIDEVSQDLGNRRFVMETMKILNTPEIAKAIEAAGGQGSVKIYKDWVEKSAIGRDPSPQNVLTRGMKKFRSGFIVSVLAAKTSTVMSQASGLPIAAQYVGPWYIAKSIKDTLGDVVNTGDIAPVIEKYKFMADKSEMMRQRLESGSYNREAQEAVDSISAKRKRQFLIPLPGTNIPQVTALKLFLGYSQAVVDTVVWHAAYGKALEGKQTGIMAGDDAAAVRYADLAVEHTQSSGRKSRQANVLTTGGEPMRWVTALQSPQVAQLNLFLALISDTVNKKRIGTLTAGKLAKAAIGLAAIGWMPSIVYNASKGNIDLDDKKKLKRQLLFAGGDMLPIASGVAGSYGGGKISSALVDNINNGLDAAGRMHDKLFPEEKDDAGLHLAGDSKSDSDSVWDLNPSDVRAVLTLLGSLTGRPGGAVGNAVSAALAKKQGKLKDNTTVGAIKAGLWKGATKANMVGKDVDPATGLHLAE